MNHQFGVRAKKVSRDAQKKNVRSVGTQLEIVCSTKRGKWPEKQLRGDLVPEPIDKQIINHMPKILDKLDNMQYGRIEFIVINGQLDRVEINHSEKVKKTG